MLTRVLWIPPPDLPWVKPNIILSDETLDMSSIPATKLPDCEAKNVLYQNVSQHTTGRKSESGFQQCDPTSASAGPSNTCPVTPGLTQLILYAEVRKQARTGENKQEV